MKIRYLLFAASLAVTLVITGCQSQTPGPSAPSEQAPVVPYSYGPSGPPEVKGPTSLPPGINKVTVDPPPQAVTESDSTEYSIK